MTPWEEHKRRQAERALRLEAVRVARRILEVQRLDMVYHGVSRIRTFTRIDREGNVTARREFVPPFPAESITIKLSTSL